MMERFDFHKVQAYGSLAKAWVRNAAGVQQAGHAFDFEKALDRLGYLGVTKDKILQDPASKAVVDARTTIKPIELDRMRQLPDGTLGRAYADMMDGLQRSTDSIPEEQQLNEASDETAFIALRLRQTRSAWRALAGYDHSPVGEASFQAFWLAQTGWPGSALNIAYQLGLSAVTDPMRAQMVMNEVCKGWLAGLKSEPFFAIDWDNHWATPISELRRRYMHARQLEVAEEIFNEATEEQVDQMSTEEAPSKRSARRKVTPSEARRTSKDA